MNARNIDELKNKILTRISDIESTFPNTILIDNISYCNLKCSMCPHKDMQRKPGIMSWGIYEKIIDEIAQKRPDARVWITFFGEGLILKDLPERIKYAKDKGLSDVVLNSNGNLLNKEVAIRLVKSGLDGLFVGIDAFKEETYERLRVGGNLQKVIDGVLEYKKALEIYGTNTQNVYVQFVEMEENQNEVEDFIKFWGQQGISAKIRPKVSWAGKVDARNLKDFSDRLPCNWAMNTINISDQGLVCLCAVDLECQVIMGDVKKQTIEEIWNQQLKEFRRNHLEKQWDNLPDMCAKCKDWQSGYAEYVNI